jgi:hypothetical protein
MQRIEALLRDTRFHALLRKYDADLAARARAAGCGCGGRLHSATYPRKPRGGPNSLDDGYGRRDSFCCAVKGCRRRTTPSSLRFLGRRVYLGVVVLLAAAMRQGPTPVRAMRLHELLGTSARTLRRWRRWWCEVFPASTLWRAMPKLLVSPKPDANLPVALLDAFRTRGRVWRSVVVLTLQSLASGFAAKSTIAAAP